VFGEVVVVELFLVLVVGAAGNALVEADGLLADGLQVDVLAFTAALGR
jgi:hypothetical protein